MSANNLINMSKQFTQFITRERHLLRGKTHNKKGSKVGASGSAFFLCAVSLIDFKGVIMCR